MRRHSRDAVLGEFYVNFAFLFLHLSMIHTSHDALYFQLIVTRCATAMSVVKKLIGRNIELIVRHGAMKTSESDWGGNYMHELARHFVLSLLGYQCA